MWEPESCDQIELVELVELETFYTGAQSVRLPSAPERLQLFKKTRVQEQNNPQTDTQTRFGEKLWFWFALEHVVGSFLQSWATFSPLLPHFPPSNFENLLR